MTRLDELKTKLKEEQAADKVYKDQGRPAHLYDSGRKSRIAYLKSAIREEKGDA